MFPRVPVTRATGANNQEPDATRLLKGSPNKPPRGLDEATKKILLAPKIKMRGSKKTMMAE